jgi:hypothetical protein
MRKSVVEAQPAEARTTEGWPDVEKLASVQVTSEDPAYPIESVFSNSGGWRAARESVCVSQKRRFPERSNSFLRSSGPGGQPFREIVRQQWNFSPDGSTEELEDYRVDLNRVAALELTIQPEITGGKAVATLASWRVA